MELNDIKTETPRQGKGGTDQMSEQNGIQTSRDDPVTKDSKANTAGTNLSTRDKGASFSEDDPVKIPGIAQLQRCVIFMETHRKIIVRIIKCLLLVGYFVYLGFAIAHHVGDEGSWRLIICTILGLCLIAWHFVKKTKYYNRWKELIESSDTWYSEGKKSLIVRW